MKKISASLVAMGFAFIVGTSSGLANETEFEYPELQVTPRATQRLESESKLERDLKWMSHLPIQVSGLTTLTAGLLLSSNTDLSKDPDKKASMGGVTVGGAWVVTTLLLSSFYAPYSDELGEIQAMPAKSRREQLHRERMAEEVMSRAAKTGKFLSWISWATQIGISLYMISNAKDESTAKVAAGISALTSFAPLIFTYRWQRVSENQQDYKKRIYSPIASAGFVPVTSERGSSLAPVVSWTLQF